MTNITIKHFLLSILIASGITGCKTLIHEHVDEKQYGDNALTCSQRQAEIDELEQFIERAEPERGESLSNMYRFWEFLLVQGIYEYQTVDGAIKAATVRRDYLIRLMSIVCPK